MLLFVGPTKATTGIANWAAPHLGLHMLAAWVRRQTDVRVTVYDPSVDGPVPHELYRQAQWVGFSLTNETLPEDIAEILSAQRVNPKAVLVIGGVEATLNYQEVLDRTAVEWVVLGSGQEAIVSIIRGATQIPGTIHRYFNEAPLDAKLWQYYEALDFGQIGYQDYWRRTAALYDTPNLDDVHTVRLVTSTHCNRGCAFCSVTQWQRLATGRHCRPARLSAEQLLQLVNRVKSELSDTRTIYFCEDDFCLSRERVDAFCEHSAGLGLSYLIQTHSSRVDEPLISVLRRGGVRHLTLGIENVSPDVLRSFGKWQDLERVPRIISWCKGAEIRPYLLIILFAPSSKMTDLRLNVDVLRRWIDQGATVSIEPFTMPYRGAPLFTSEHEFLWRISPIEGGVAPIKSPSVILPDDPDVRTVMLNFRRQWPGYRETHAPCHQFKGETGTLMLDLLDDILKGSGA